MFVPVGMYTSSVTNATPLMDRQPIYALRLHRLRGSSYNSLFMPWCPFPPKTGPCTHVHTSIMYASLHALHLANSTDSHESTVRLATHS